MDDSRLLLTDEAMMARIGFNAHQVAHGTNRRGEDRRKEPVEIRGALSYETIADALVTIEQSKLERLFNAAPFASVTVISPPCVAAGSRAATRWPFMMSTS